METIQVVLDRKLLQAADRAARRTKRNSSALVGDALREHLRKLDAQALEERDREGYSKQPETPEILRFRARIPGPEGELRSPFRIPAPESALGLRLRRALPSTQ